jgi:hypothetical protein
MTCSLGLWAVQDDNQEDGRGPRDMAVTRYRHWGFLSPEE